LLVKFTTVLSTIPASPKLAKKYTFIGGMTNSV